MSNTPSERQCRVEEALGRMELCAERGCFFWQEGVTETQGGCLFDRVDFAGRHDLAQLLHDVRADAEGAKRSSNDEIRQRFFERLNAGRTD